MRFDAFNGAFNGNGYNEALVLEVKKQQQKIEPYKSNFSVYHGEVAPLSLNLLTF